jgi:hypothetical protein
VSFEVNAVAADILLQLTDSQSLRQYVPWKQRSSYSKTWHHIPEELNPHNNTVIFSSQTFRNELELVI